MSMLHSFYCWGQVGVVLISTIFFSVAGIGNWKIMAALWAVVPVVNALVFTKFHGIFAGRRRRRT